MAFCDFSFPLLQEDPRYCLGWVHLCVVIPPPGAGVFSVASLSVSLQQVVVSVGSCCCFGPFRQYISLCSAVFI